MRDPISIIEEDILPDDEVMDLVRMLTPVQKIFLAGLGRGLTPGAAARRAGWPDDVADRMADSYLTADAIMKRLATHILAMRELASLDGEEPVFKGSDSIH